MVFDLLFLIRDEVKVTFDLVALIDVAPDLGGFVVGEVTDLGIGTDPESATDVLGAGESDSVDVGEADLEPLVAGEVDACNTCHQPITPDAACVGGSNRSPRRVLCVG